MEITLDTGLTRKNDDGTEEAVKTASIRLAHEGDEIEALMTLAPDVHSLAAERMVEKIVLASRTEIGGVPLTIDTWAALTRRDADLIRAAARKLDGEG